MAKLSVKDQMIYNKFKTRREKAVTLLELADVIWNGNKPKEMSMGMRYACIWKNDIRQYIIHINKLIWPDEIIKRTAPGTYMLTEQDPQKFLELIVRIRREANSVEKSDELFQDINSGKLPLIENGIKLENAKKDSYFSCRALQDVNSWMQRMRESIFKKNGKMLKVWKP